MAAKHKTPREMIGGMAPKLIEISDNVLYGDVWERPGLSKRDRSLVTVAALMALYRGDQLRFHLNMALDNGLTPDELIEVFTHLAFYASWPNAVTAISHLRNLVEGDDEQPGAAL